MEDMENSTFTTFLTSTIGNHVKEFLTFSWVDYVLFSAMFGISALIGIYFGCFGSKQATTKEYLLGGKNMSIFPIAMSLIASNLSGITLLAIPAEIYVYGTQYWIFIVCSITVVLALIFIYLPVFYTLQLNSSYEYFNRRFDQSIRNMASGIFIVKTLLYVPIIIYIPAIAFNQVTGISIHHITPIICLICIFYTTLGGLKAVVWTDTLQFSVTILAMMTVFYMGTNAAGGVGEIWKAADESGRIEFFNMNPDPTERCTFWGIAIGMSVTWVAHAGIHQACVQRYLSLPSLRSAKIAAVIFGGGVILTKSLACFSGLIMYAKYRDCDPLASGQVKRMDQMLPFYVLDVASVLPGLSGIFISGVFSTALSTMSTSLNTTAGTIYEDFLLPNKIFKASERNGSLIMKITVLTVGILCVGMVFLVEQLGGVLQIFMTFSGLTGGPLLGLFTLGMLFPSANTKGALYSSLVSFALVSWMCIGQQLHRVSGNMANLKKPVSIEGCDFLNLTSIPLTTTMAPEVSPEEPFWLFKVSFYWYSLIGFTIVVVLGLIISHFTKDEKAPPVDRDLLSPIIYRFLPKDYPVKSHVTCEYMAVELQNGRKEDFDGEYKNHKDNEPQGYQDEKNCPEERKNLDDGDEDDPKNYENKLNNYDANRNKE